ncbi:conserved hypothetical protein [Gammaproteobacteria bacterium]
MTRYSDYQDLKDLEKNLSITYQLVDLFPSIQPVEPTPFLLHNLAIAKLLPSTFSEKARSENLITPILFDVYEYSQQSITIFSGCSLNINEQLSGICDYIIAGKGRLLVLDSPIVCIVEAKNRSIEEGLAQAGAEMMAAQLFNQQEQNAIEVIYGVVTNGIDWRFLKLHQNVLYIDENMYFSSGENLKILLGVFGFILFRKNLGHA